MQVLDRAGFSKELVRGSEDLERRREVAPAGSNLNTARSRGRSGLSRSGNDVPKRHPDVSRLLVIWERRPGATCRGRSTAGSVYSPSPIHHFLSSKARLGKAYLSSWVVKLMVPMVKKTKRKLNAEKQEAERKESALRGKALASEPAGSGTQRTSRQQTLATKKSKDQEKRA
ncbi:hypothetical protein F2Q70_00043528 [Brassica cretica]|uniref:Uncharacterized protein n=1 Tax=Brassica cretica TaxID=69181 RepID=A0A8S9KK81_BRACR|nr:hypothetical protein F2Q70_00043528 [Brassica cretica]